MPTAVQHAVCPHSLRNGGIVEGISQKQGARTGVALLPLQSPHLLASGVDVVQAYDLVKLPTDPQSFQRWPKE